MKFGNSKSRLKLINKRLEMIRKRRKAVQKFLKKDIADLLSYGLDDNAYGRVIFFHASLQCSLSFNSMVREL